MPEAGPLSAEQKAQLGDASARLHRLLRAARISSVTFWTTLGCGAASLVWSLLSAGGGIVVAAALLAVAWNERRGRDRLRALDPHGARILGWNQIAIAGVIIGYSLIALLHARASVDPSLNALGKGTTAMVAQLTRLIYGAVIFAVAVSQALLARYYFHREPMMQAFRNETPDWIVEVLEGSEGNPA